MSGHTYDIVSVNDSNGLPSQENIALLSDVPDSPPPSFRSDSPVASLEYRDPNANLSTDLDRNLEDTFNGLEYVGPNVEEDSRQRFLSTYAIPDQRDYPNRHLPSPSVPGRDRPDLATTMSTLGNIRGLSSSANDGVFANLSAKPEPGEKVEEQPPSYEQAAADATPPYWETTIFTPGMLSDEVYIDGLPVGSFFSFAWNGIISMAFQLVGFLLTYLLHTTHAARHGSRAGLGVTLINIGFRMKNGTPQSSNASQPVYDAPVNPNDHSYDSLGSDSPIHSSASVEQDSSSSGLAGGEWLTYALMIIGWVILIKAIADFIKARRHEQLILQSPDRTLGAGNNERTESIV